MTLASIVVVPRNYKKNSMPRSSSSPPRPRRQAAAPRPKPLLLLALALLLAACVLPCLPAVEALTREQAEQIDWHRRGVGKVTSAFFVDRSSSSSSGGSGSGSGPGSASDAILVAAAREGTVALLETSSGEIVWRRVRRRRKKRFGNQKHQSIDDLNLVLDPLCSNSLPLSLSHLPPNHSSSTPASASS